MKLQQICILITCQVVLSSGLRCYQCQGKGGECQVSADPGKEMTCPTVHSLIEDAVKTNFDYRWKTLPVKKSRNDLIGLITNLFNDSLPQKFFAESLVANAERIYSNTTSLDMLEMIMEMLTEMTDKQVSNICLYHTKIGGDEKPYYIRKCLYTRPMALSDWSWVSDYLSQQSQGLEEDCGEKCSKTFCSKDLCNDKGVYRCMVCQGASYLCAENELGMSIACPADHTYCIKELSGDSSNRKLSARYCGTKYDSDSVCGSEGEKIGIAVKGEVKCCSNRKAQNCNSAESVNVGRLTMTHLVLFLWSAVELFRP